MGLSIEQMVAEAISKGKFNELLTSVLRAAPIHMLVKLQNSLRVLNVDALIKVDDTINPKIMRVYFADRAGYTYGFIQTHIRGSVPLHVNLEIHSVSF